MEPLKHECGIVMIRLRKPLEYYKQKYGTYGYGLAKLYLMMEKQHNRGQEGAGIGVVKLNSIPGHEYVWRERALGAQAIQEIFATVHERMKADDVESMSVEEADALAPFVGEVYMGHLRYSTTGKSGISYVHPFLRRNNWRSRNLLMCGNFNMTNVDRIFHSVVGRGQHPRLYSDTIVLLEQLGDALDKENHRIYRKYRDQLRDPELTYAIERDIDMRRVLEACTPNWDGGYVICGSTGSGSAFVMRDPNGIRPAFYYIDEEVVVATSERPVIQTVMGVDINDVHELEPGMALLVGKDGSVSVDRILPEGRNERCSFERIYFSRGSDADIYRERKALGRYLVPDIVRAVGGESMIDHAVFSFIPNTAEVAALGMIEGITEELDSYKCGEIMAMSERGELDRESLRRIMSRRPRVEKAVIKDIKLRTFIAEGDVRNDMATHVYDVTWGCVRKGEDALVVIDDSIVRGTTLKQSILRMLSRLSPRKIVVVSSSPQVRYPDYYGIDMSRMGEFIAFRAAVALLHKRGMAYLLDDTYRRCVAAEGTAEAEQCNFVKAIYEPFTDREISAQIAEMVNPGGLDVEIVYQTLAGLHKAVPDNPGDWYFSGNYPTPGGYRLVNRAFVNYYEGNIDKR